MLKTRIIWQESFLKSQVDESLDSLSMIYQREKAVSQQLMNAIFDHDKTSDENRRKLFSEKISYLLENDGMLGNTFKPATSTGGRTALHFAAVTGDTKLIEMVKEKWGKDFFNQLEVGDGTLNLTPLQLAIFFENFEMANFLISLGAKTNVNTPLKSVNQLFLSVLIAEKDLEALKFCLALNPSNLLERNSFEQTFLSELVQEPLFNQVLKDLLAKEGIKEALNSPDIFGKRPADLAEANIDISQERIQNQMHAYLELKGWDTAFLPKKGHCEGFSALAAYYTSREKQSEYYQILQIISQWDGTLEGLAEQSQSLQSLSGNYTCLDELLQQCINDVVWFQHYLPLDKFMGFETNLRQGQLTELYEIVKKDATKFTKIAPSLTLKQASSGNIAEVLRLASLYPHSLVVLGGGNHATHAWVQEDKGFKYYDSNMPAELAAFYSSEKLAKFIENAKYKMLGKEGSSLEVDFYQLVEGESPQLAALPSSGAKLDAHSPNGFSPFHLAIFANNLELLEKYMLDEGLDINAPTKDGLTPLLFAMQKPGNEAIVQLLLKSKKIKLDGAIVLAAKLKETGILELLLTSGHTFDIDEKGSHDLCGLSDPDCIDLYLKLIPLPTPFSYAMKNNDLKALDLLIAHGMGFLGDWKTFAASNASLQTWQLLVNSPNFPHQGNLLSEYLYTILISKNKDKLQIMQLLLDKGANPNYIAETNKSILLCALERKEDEIFSLLLKHLIEISNKK